MCDRSAQALEAAVGVHDRALLLGVGVGGEDDVGVFGQPLGKDARVGDDHAGLAKRALPQRAVGLIADRVGLEQVQSADVAVRGGLRDLPGAAAGVAGQLAVSGAAVREDAGLAQTAPVAPGRELEQPRPLVVGQAKALGDTEQRVERRRVEAALAPDDHDVLAAGAQIFSESSHVRGLRIPRRGVAGQGGVQRGQESRLVAGGIAPGQARVRIQGARPIGGDRQPDAAPAHALSDPQVEDRGVVEGLAADDQDRVGELEVRHRGLQTRSGQGARELGGHRAARA